MEVSVERIAPCEVNLTVEIPAEAVDRALAAQYRELAREVQIRGFRKGKAPRRLLEARFGKQVQAETARDLIADHIEEALRQADVAAVGEPDFDNDPVESGRPLVFRLRFEIRPDFEPTGYRGVALPLPPVEIDEEDVERTLANLRERQSRIEPIDEDGATADIGVIVAFDSKATLDGEPFAFGSGEGAELELGSGLSLPGFEDQLMGVEEGGTRGFDLVLPEDFPDEEQRGKTVHFEVEVSALKRKIVPTLDDDFAKTQGVDGLERLRESIREQILAAKKRAAMEGRQRAVLDRIVDANVFDLPPSLLAREVERRKAQLTQNLVQSGLDEVQVGALFEGRDDAMQEAASRSLREHFLLARIAELEGIEVGDDEREAFFDELAGQMGQPVQKIKAQFHSDDAKERVDLELLDRKTRAALLEWSVEQEAVADAPDAGDGDTGAPGDGATEEADVVAAADDDGAGEPDTPAEGEVASAEAPADETPEDVGPAEDGGER